MDSSFFFRFCGASITFFTVLGTIFFMFCRKFKLHQENKTIATTTSSSLSHPSAPFSFSQNWKHHVFPSFHGTDVRKTFLSHILKEFRGKGIEPFIDNNIERSKSIGPELIEAIRGSNIAIVLLSRNYASSSWCLNELVEIMKCRKELGQIVMTVFYEVDPSDIKKQTGDFGKVFIKTCKGRKKEEINKWRKALEGVATIAGEHSRNWDNEAVMIEKIAIDVSNKLNNSTPSKDFDSLVQMGAHMENLGTLLRLDLDEVRMIGIWGPPGIGKTTIARFLFSQVSGSFQLRTIMVNIKGYYPRPCLDEYSVQLKLQNQMLSQMINHKDIMIPHLGVAQERLKDKKVFLVLDDVDRLGQLVSLAKETRWFGPGSRIIVTTEDLRVLKAHGINHIYKVNFPSSDEALQIFCMHAFGQKHPYDGFYELSREVIYLAGKLPLGLKVMGSYFRGMSEQEWKNALPRLRRRLDGEIESIFKFSYDALCDDDKDLFLHIACLFNDQLIEKVEEHLSNSFVDVAQGVHVLTEKSLISINSGYIEMHNLLEQFGREIVRKQSVCQPWQRNFLVNSRDLCEVLSDDTIEYRRSVIGITLNLFTTDGDFYISDGAFEGMSNLQFLRFDYGHIHPNNRGQNFQFQKLRLLDWKYFPMKCLPSNFPTKFLIELKMRGSKLEKLWDGIQPLSNLKWIDLTHSKNLKKLPDFSTATNLRELILERCSSLMEIPSSIGNATNLEIFNLSGCSSLVEIPSSIGNAINLKIFNLKNCISLVDLPSSIGSAINLEIFDLSYCSKIVELPFSIGTITNLKELNLSGFTTLVELPSFIGNATQLMVLYIGGCFNLVKLQSFIGNATCLTVLDLSYCVSLAKLPSSVGNFTYLTELNLRGCSSLLELPSSIENVTSLTKLNLSECSNLVELPSIGNATKLEKLDLSYCQNLVKLPSSIGNVVNLYIFDIRDCSSLVELPFSIGNATNLDKLNFRGCSNLVELPLSIGNATHLTELNLSGCSSLVQLPFSIGNAINLKELNLTGCSSLVDLPFSIGYANQLKELDLNGCASLVKLPSSIGNIISLNKLNLCGCTSLVELPFIGYSTHLTELNLNGCSSLVKLPSSIGNTINLWIFDLANCSSLVGLSSSIGNATSLKELNISGCSSLVELSSSIGNATNLQTLDLSMCLNLTKLPSSIGNAINLMRLNLYGCSNLVEFPSSIVNATNLRELNLGNCSNLVELPFSIGNLQKLWKLVLEGCLKLKSLPVNINMESLEELYLSNCLLLKTFPEISKNVKLLKLNGTAVEEVPLVTQSWPYLEELHMSYCEKLKDSPHSLNSITDLHLTNTELQELGSWVKGFSRLFRLVLDGVHKLVSLPQLPDSVSEIDAENCESLERLDCSFHGPDIRLNFTNCFKLHQKARDLIIQTSKCRAVVPGEKVPAYFTYRASGSSLTVKLNQDPIRTTTMFKACFLLDNKGEHKLGDKKEVCVYLTVRSKQTNIRSHRYTIDPTLMEHLYTFDIEAKEITSTELVFKFNLWTVPISYTWEIKECGIRQLVEVPSC